MGEILNDQFHRLVPGEPSLAPSLDDALAVARHVVALNAAATKGARSSPGGP